MALTKILITRRFFQQLHLHQIIELENLGYTTRLRIIHYDYYLGKVSYCSKALTYLQNKKFNNQFVY